jgi:hypothetical protein
MKSSIRLRSLERPPAIVLIEITRAVLNSRMRAKFVLEKVTTDKVEKIINNINIKKATGADGIPAKIIRFIKHNFLFSTGPLFRKEWLNSFQKSPDFVPPEQRSKKYVFMDFLFNLVTKFLCFLNFSQFLLL